MVFETRKDQTKRALPWARDRPGVVGLISKARILNKTITIRVIRHSLRYDSLKANKETQVTKHTFGALVRLYIMAAVGKLSELKNEMRHPELKMHTKITNVSAMFYNHKILLF